MNAMVLDETPRHPQVADHTPRPVTLAVLHPKGGVGRSTTVWHLGAELALRGRRVVLEDLDQGRHLSRVFERHPLGLEALQLGTNGAGADLVILDTAPEAQRERALDYLRRSDWLLVPVKGPEGLVGAGVANADAVGHRSTLCACAWIPADDVQAAAFRDTLLDD